MFEIIFDIAGDDGRCSLSPDGNDNGVTVDEGGHDGVAETWFVDDIDGLSVGSGVYEDAIDSGTRSGGKDKVCFLGEIFVIDGIGVRDEIFLEVRGEFV